MLNGILHHDKSVVNPYPELTDSEYAQFVDEYNAWHDEHFEPVTDEEINDMARQDEAQRNGWRLERMNGQTLVNVDGVIVGHIFTIHNDDIYNLHWTHSFAKNNGWGRQSWIEQEACINDLVSRYNARFAKREPVQLADGSWVNANPEDVDFLNWISERKNGGY